MFDEIELQEISKNIQEAVPDLITINGKKLILLLGATGAGKSTLIYYQMGGKLKMVGSSGRNQRVEPDDPNNNSYPAIYSRSESGTKVPRAYSAQNQDFYYCDVPGFQENRDVGGPEIQYICNTLMLQSAMERAELIKGIIVTIDFLSIKESRSLLLGPILESLYKVLQYPNNIEDIGDSLTFVVTKSDPQNEVDTLEIIKTTKNKLEEQINYYDKRIETMQRLINDKTKVYNLFDKMKRKLRMENSNETAYQAELEKEIEQTINSNLDDEKNKINNELKAALDLHSITINRFQRLKQLCKLMIQKIDNDKVIVSNVMDAGQTREKIINSFNNTSLDKKYLKFHKNDKSRYKFDCILYNFAKDGLLAFNQYLMAKQMLAGTCDNLQLRRYQLNDLKAQLAMAKNNNDMEANMQAFQKKY